MQYGLTPIHFAASKGNTEIIEMLMQHKCDIEVIDKVMLTYLRFSINFIKSLAITRELILK